MNIPLILAAGDSASWTDTSFRTGDGKTVSSGEYSLSYSLRGGGAGVDLAAIASGAGWSTSISTEQSAALNTSASNAIWYWQAYASKAGERVLAGEGTLTIKPNFADLTGTFDGRTPAERDLDAVKAEISSRINGGATLEYSIGTRSLKKEPIAALMALQDRLQMAVNRQKAAQRIANGQGNPGKVLVRFR
jgi:hypothetical protein